MDPNAQNGGTAPSDNGTVKPTEGDTSVDPKIAELEKKLADAEKSQTDLKELQTYFGARPSLYDGALLYDKDPKFKEMVDAYVSGKPIENDQVNTPDDLDLSSLTDDQRKIVATLAEKIVEEKMQGVTAELSQLKKFYAQGQIDGFRTTYTKQNGWPFEFKEKENEVTKMLENGLATNAESAFLQLVGQSHLQTSAETNKKLTEQKREMSMSRYSTPSVSVRRSQEGKMSFLDAIRHAQEQLGQGV